MKTIAASSQASCRNPAADCSLTADAARARILAALPAPPPARLRPIREALGGVLAQDIVAPIDVPAHTNSAVDGYAVCGDDLDTAGGARLQPIGQVLAGRPLAGSVGRGQCVEIMTGGAMPAGTDTAIMLEDCERADAWVHIRAGQQRGQNVRLAGEDLARGSIVMRAGERLLPPHIGVLASLGLTEVAVHRSLRVAFFVTGDELRTLGQPLGAGQIYDSNSYTLHAMLARLGAAVLDLGVVEDDPQALRRALTGAARQADAVITTGGVSVGEADYVRPLLEELGQVGFWKIAIKPGRPFAFGHLDEALFFGLPGNPVATMVTFYQFVQPALRRLGGETRPAPPTTFRVRCQNQLRKQRGRTEYVRAVLEADADGELSVRTLRRQGSGVLTSMTQSNCFVVLEHDAGSVEAGELVSVQPFAGLL